MRRFLNRLFRLEEINGNGMCPTYLYRWTLSIGLRGSYTEIAEIDLPPGAGLGRMYTRTLWRAPWVRSFPATHRHRLIGPTPESPCWTVVVVGRATRSWGFWPQGEFVPWRQYVDSPSASERRSCP